MALDVRTVLFALSPDANQAKVNMTFAWHAQADNCNKLASFHSVLDPQKFGMQVANIQVFGDNQHLLTQQHSNASGWTIVEWTFDPPFVKRDDAQAICLECSIANTDKFLQCGSNVVHLSVLWLNCWKSQMPPAAMHVLQAVNDDLHIDAGGGLLGTSVTPLPWSGLPMESSNNKVSVTHASEELWFCVGARCFCGLELTHQCQDDPQPWIVDFQLLSNGDLECVRHSFFRNKLSHSWILGFRGSGSLCAFV